MIPRTYLLSAPAKEENPWGRTILSSDIVKGLQRINVNLRVPLPEQYEEWYPLKAMGITCLWLGEPGKGRKIGAFRLGPVPEFTMMDGAWMVARGWRAIFDKVIKAGAATRSQIEKEFKVVLEYEGNDGSCRACRKKGTLRKADSDLTNLCHMCESVAKAVEQGQKRKDHVKDLVSKTKRRSAAQAAQKELDHVRMDVRGG